MSWLPFIFALFLVVVHLLAQYIHVIDSISKKRVLSIAGGVSVAYVFIHILPEFKHHQEAIEQQAEWLSFLEHHVYMTSMLGLIIFYGLEKAVKHSKKKYKEEYGENKPSPGAFWVHMSSFFVYNALIGYLLVHREGEGGWVNLLLYSIAMGLHFFVVDYSLRTHHKDRYTNKGRWILSIALLVGWGVGALTEIPDPMLALLFAFLSGAIILNVLKEELPEERQSSYWSFALGAAGYMILLIAV
ncbi:hypothetical protein [Pseudalkalibacillus caeni]|uniref:ZIP Zinc transporter n=1 Tax=Exobacillus caeni TaxID=2574798 RepID=A0A5R9F2R7_9BACL|nr:hypothetical protein [Pseudalkalibacillus caeni]TLS36606.1 hypothetical protein FCL54_13870 [Pseudalkalibacillus caeni]